MWIVWTPEAEQDRAVIWDYLDARDPDAAASGSIICSAMPWPG